MATRLQHPSRCKRFLLDYKEEVSIAKGAIEIFVDLKDIIGVAETGSGKTASFVLPMLMYINKLPRMTPDIEADGPYALIMAPTRELVQQIEAETVKFAVSMGFRCVSLVGGVCVLPFFCNIEFINIFFVAIY